MQNGSTDPFIGESDPLSDLYAEFPDLLLPQVPEDNELARLLHDTPDPLNSQPPTTFYNAPQMTTPFVQTPFQHTQAGILDGFPRFEDLVLQGPSQPTQNGFIDSLVYQGASQSNQIQPQQLTQQFPVASSSAGTSPLSDAPPERFSSSLSDSPPALPPRSSAEATTTSRRAGNLRSHKVSEALWGSPSALPPRSPVQASTSRNAGNLSSRKASKVSVSDDEPIEVVPRRFFPPVGARKQHRSGFRQLPGPDGIVKRGRPSKKAYKRAGVEVDMYAHKKILLPANGDDVDMAPPKSKKKAAKPKKAARNVRSAKATTSGRPSVRPVGTQYAPPLPNLPQVAPYSFSQPPARQSQMNPSVDLSSPNFDWNGFLASLGPPPEPMVLTHQTQGHMNSFSMNPSNRNSVPMLQTQSDGNYPMVQTQSNLSNFPMAQTQSHGGYGQDFSHLPVPYNTPYPSTSSSSRLRTLGMGLEPDFQSFNFQDGGASSTGQLSSVGNYPGFRNTASFSQAPGMSGLGPTEYGSFPVSNQASSMGTSNSHIGSFGQPNELYNSFQHSLPAQAPYMGTSVSDIGSSHHRQSTGFDTNLFQPNNQFGAPATNFGVSAQPSGLDLNTFTNQQVQYGAPAANVGASNASTGFDLNAFLNQQGQYEAPVANVGASTASTGVDNNLFQPNNQFGAPAANVGASTASTGFNLDTFLNQQGQYETPAANVGASTTSTGFGLNTFLNQRGQYEAPAPAPAPAPANVAVDTEAAEFDFEAFIAQKGEYAPPNTFL